MTTLFKAEPQSQIVHSHRVAEWIGQACESLFEKRLTGVPSDVVETFVRPRTPDVRSWRVKACADAPSKAFQVPRNSAPNWKREAF
jgi:hypothetical protein